jgi:photosystem II stability/assembly factor-like uncharacterized protein
VKKLFALSLLPLLVLPAGSQSVRSRFLSERSESAPVWESIGPYGGYVRALAANPADPSEIFAVAYTGQIFRSQDGSRTWTLLAVKDVALYDIAFSPSRPDIVYIVSARGLFVSTDRGVQWTERLFPTGCSSQANIWVSPSDPDRIQIGGSYWTTSSGGAALLKSSDGGRTWTYKGFSSAYSGVCYRMAVDSSDPNIIYAGASFYISTGGSSYYNFYKTTDGGATWRVIYGGTGPIAIAVDPRNPLRVFASSGSGSSGGMLRSLDGGLTWTRTSDATGQSIVFDPLQPDTIYAGWGNAFYKTIDGGVSWTRLTGNLDGFCTSILLLGGKTLFGSTAGVFASTDGGATWSEADQGMNARNVSAFAVSPTAPATVYSVAEWYPQSSYIQGVVYKSLNSGAVWTKLSITLSNLTAAPQILVDPLYGERLWIREQHSLWRSENGGLNWLGLPARTYMDDLGDLAVSARTSGYLVLAGTGIRYPGAVPYMAFERSLDAGTSWSIFPVTLEKSSGSAIALDPQDGNIIFVGGEKGGPGALFRSRDGGASWTEIDGNAFGTDPVAAIGIDSEDGNRLFVGTAGGFFATENGGTSWTKSAVLPVRTIHVLRADPRQILIAGASGVFWTGDRGATWTELGADLPSRAVSGIQLLSEGATLYAGTASGIFRKTFAFPARIYAPLTFAGTSVVNRSLSQSETIHILHWSANPKNADIVKTRIYSAAGTRLGRLLSEQSASLLEFKVRNAASGAAATYAVVAVDKAGREGEPAFATVR